MTHFIIKSNPQRWKVMQVLPIKGQNDKYIDQINITDRQFQYFINNHQHIEYLISEANSDMINSYAMIDPAGRFFNNTTSAHTYSAHILEVGIKYALNQMDYNYQKFRQRKGEYNW